MMDLHPVLQALVATSFNWGMTALGASTVLIHWGLGRKMLDVMLGFTAGIMIAASYWSLLAPAIALSVDMGLPAWLPAATGFLLGGAFLKLMDRLLPHLHLGFPMEEAEGIKSSWRRTTLIVAAITLHNIPEGLTVGVAFGALAARLPSATLYGAVALTIGIGIQNIIEGLAVAMSLRREAVSPLKSFWYGQLSGIVEPIAGVFGALLVVVCRPLLPYALAFAAGAMIYVVVEEVVPESQCGHHADLATIGALVGFTLMMVLAVGIGN